MKKLSLLLATLLLAGNAHAADTPISGWPAAAGVSRTMQLIVNDSGTTKRISMSEVYADISLTTDISTGSGAQSLALGTTTTTATGADSIAIGADNADATNNSAIAIGNDTNASGDSGIAIGHFADATGSGGIGIGKFANGNATDAVAIGESADGTGTRSTAVGNTSDATATDSSAFGAQANADGARSTAIGKGANTGTYTDTTALGEAATCTANNQVCLGTAAEHVFIPGDLHVSGSTIGLVSNSLIVSHTTLDFIHMGDLLRVSNTNPISITVPSNTLVAFDVGTTVNLTQENTGLLGVEAGSGVTIQSSGGKVAAAAQYSVLTLIKIATDTWLLMGDAQ